MKKPFVRLPIKKNYCGAYSFTNCLYATFSPFITFIVYTPLTRDDTSSCTTLSDAFDWIVLTRTPIEDTTDIVDRLLGFA